MSEKNPQQHSGEPYIVGLRFQRVGKIYHFDASNVLDLKQGDFAVVETSRGRQLGQMVYTVTKTDINSEGGIKPVLRRATPQDLILKQSWEQKESEAVINCQEKAAELGFTGVKIVSAEISFDGSRLNLLYSSEEGDKVDLKTLKRVMQRLYAPMHIEMHLVGPRDVAKILGGMGACGLEIRCCAAFLPDFSPISIKMAKEQGVSLTPTEITGMCGRLRCCLVYEYEQYAEARKMLPKRGKRVSTPTGEGRVVDVLALKSAVVVDMDSDGQHEFSSQDIRLIDEQEQARKKGLPASEKQLEKGRSGRKKRRSKGNE